MWSERERQNVIVDHFLEGVTCLLLADPDNGQVIVGGVTVGSTARYICQSGFVLQGSDETTCLSSGTWSNLPPVCVAVNCADLPEPFNGEIIYSREISETVNVFGSTATYRSPSFSLFFLTLFFLTLYISFSFSTVPPYSVCSVCAHCHRCFKCNVCPLLQM